jgi:hypothetical protein
LIACLAAAQAEFLAKFAFKVAQFCVELQDVLPLFLQSKLTAPCNAARSAGEQGG